MDKPNAEEPLTFDVEMPNGKALSPTGRRTAARIVETACEILRTEGYERFSMQGIAKRMGRRLSNVQYYFKTREDLIRAVIQHIEQGYLRRYAAVLEAAPDTAEGRFRAALEFNFEDVGDPDTRHLFIQLWPLLSTADNYSGELMQRLYLTQFQALGERIRELAPEANADEVRIRAELIAALIEGLLVTAPANVDTPTHRRRLGESVLQTAYAIATGDRIK